MNESSPSSAPKRAADILERITLQMASSLDLQIVLTTITQGLIDELDGAFARIWLLGPGDLCADCMNRDRCLHLEACADGMASCSSGLDGSIACPACRYSSPSLKQIGS